MHHRSSTLVEDNQPVPMVLLSSHPSKLADCVVTLLFRVPALFETENRFTTTNPKINGNYTPLTILQEAVPDGSRSSRRCCQKNDRVREERVVLSAKREHAGGASCQCSLIPRLFQVIPSQWESRLFLVSFLTQTVTALSINDSIGTTSRGWDKLPVLIWIIKSCHLLPLHNNGAVIVLSRKTFLRLRCRQQWSRSVFEPILRLMFIMQVALTLSV